MIHRFYSFLIDPAYWAGSEEPTTGVALGRNVTLVCDVCMKPKGHIEWFKDEYPIHSNISISDNGHYIKYHQCYQLTLVIIHVGLIAQ